MQTPRFRLSRLLSRLGVQGPEEPELLPYTQPGAAVGDFREFAAQVRAPSGGFGSLIGSAAGVYATMELRPRAPGGMFVDELEIIEAAPVGSATYFRMSMETSISALAQSTPQALTLDAPLWRVATGTSVILGSPLRLGIGTPNWRSIRGFWVPPGRYFRIQAANAAAPVVAAVRARDVLV